MASILSVGIATLDIINHVEHYPAEDSEVRAIDQRLARGGNAANTAEVLARLGHSCRWAGVLADEPDAGPIRAGFDALAIDYSGARLEPRGKVPTSYITASRTNGSRTIVHHRDLPEFSAADFARLDLTGLDWIHFEGRNVEETRQMLTAARRNGPGRPVSVELEKPRAGLLELAALADVVLCGRAWAEAHGHADGEGALAAILQPGQVGFCAWGEAGGWMRDGEGRSHHRPACPPDRLTDTVGAGDVFNAGVIDTLVAGGHPEEALEWANRLSGDKCGRVGFCGLELARR